jgi:hypothetical protein
MRLSRKEAAAVVVLSTIAGVFAGYGASSWALQAADPTSINPQMPNATAKADSLPQLLRASITVPESRRYAVASVTTDPDFEQFYDVVTSAMPMMPAVPAEVAAAPEIPATQAAPMPTPIAAAPPPAPKPKPLPPPPSAPMGLLDEGQIAGIKTRLRLTSGQAEYWPAVETALRAVAKTQLREMRLNRNTSGKVNIDVNSPEVQQLVWAAMPLLQRLREDQKREVRRLVRVIGLDQLASQI